LCQRLSIPSIGLACTLYQRRGNRFAPRSRWRHTLTKANGSIVEALPVRQRVDFAGLVDLTELVTAAATVVA
jgi:hypothetical protein